MGESLLTTLKIDLFEAAPRLPFKAVPLRYILVVLIIRSLAYEVNMPAIPATPAQPPTEASPFRLFEAINAFQLTEAIRSAIELDIFTAIGTGHTTAQAVATHCTIAERGARILCDFLVVNGFLRKSGNQYSSNEHSAKFLDRNSPAYLGSCTGFYLPMIYGKISAI